MISLYVGHANDTRVFCFSFFLRPTEEGINRSKKPFSIFGKACKPQNTKEGTFLPWGFFSSLLFVLLTSFSFASFLNVVTIKKSTKRTEKCHQ